MIGVGYGAAAVLHLGKDQFFRLNIDEVHVDQLPRHRNDAVSRGL